MDFNHSVLSDNTQLHKKISALENTVQEIKETFQSLRRELESIQLLNAEVLLRQKIGVFLSRWNRMYRCSFHYNNNNCNLTEQTCAKIHCNDSHSMLAKEIRTFLKVGNLNSYNGFFSNLYHIALKNKYNSVRVRHQILMDLQHMLAY